MPKNIMAHTIKLINRVIFILIIFMLGIFEACNQQHYQYPTIKIESNYGDIVIELYKDKAPQTVKAFLSYIDSGYFKNSSFYRVLKSEDQPSSVAKSNLIQGGIWESNNKLALGLKGIVHESTKQTGLLHKNGIISLARTTPGTANSEFFICIGDQPSYDYGGNANPDKQGFAAFGMVIKGMEVVRQIHQQPDYNGNFRPVIEILDIVRL